MKKLFSIAAIILSATALQAREGFYMGAEAGVGFLSRTPKKDEIKKDLEANRAKRDLTRILGGAHVGYIFDIDEQWSVAPELGFRAAQKARFRAFELLNSGSVITTANASHQLNVIDFLAVGTYRLDSQWDIQGMLGAALVVDKIKMHFPEYTLANGLLLPEFSKSKTKKTVCPEIGIRIGYLFDTNIRTYAGLTHIFGRKVSFKHSDVNLADPVPGYTRSENESFDSFCKVPSLTSLTIGVEYLF